MRQFRRYGALIFGSLFVFSLVMTVLLYLLRGSGIFPNMSGGIIIFFILLTIITGIIFGIEQTKT